MPNYRRAWHPGGTYFFTVNLLERSGNDLLTRHIAELREAVRVVRRDFLFEIHAWVVLPDHLYCGHLEKLPFSSRSGVAHEKFILTYQSYAASKFFIRALSRLETGVFRGALA